jgi:hypothetical protein
MMQYVACSSIDGLDTMLQNKKQTTSVALARERTVPTEWAPLVGEVSANFCG